MIMKVSRSSETSVYMRTTLRCMSEDGSIHWQALGCCVCGRNCSIVGRVESDSVEGHVAHESREHDVTEEEQWAVVSTDRKGHIVLTLRRTASRATELLQHR
jgi:hypothetical protein